MKMNKELSSTNSRLNDGTLFVSLKGGKMTCQKLEAGSTIEVDSCYAHKYRPLERSMLEAFPAKCGCSCDCEDVLASPAEELAVALTAGIREKVDARENKEDVVIG